jgi:hypothetical protein
MKRAGRQKENGQNISSRRDQERAPPCGASQGRRERYRTTARLYARRSAGTMSDVGKETTDRLRAVL